MPLTLRLPRLTVNAIIKVQKEVEDTRCILASVDQMRAEIQPSQHKYNARRV